jgi:hypothetical protein
MLRTCSSPLLSLCGKVSTASAVRSKFSQSLLLSVPSPKKYVLDGHADPRQASPAQHFLNLLIARLIKKFGDDDPPPQPKLAVPVSTIRAIATQYSFGPHHMAVADMVVVAIFYLLRVGKYTKQARARGTKRTVPLRKCDVRLWRDGVLLNHKSGVKALWLADNATISIAHTKNGTKGAVVHHDAIGGEICPVAALARRVANLHGMSTTTPLALCAIVGRGARLYQTGT